MQHWLQHLKLTSRNGAVDTPTVIAAYSTHCLVSLSSNQNRRISKAKCDLTEQETRHKSVRFDARPWDGGNPGCGPHGLLAPGQPQLG